MAQPYAGLPRGAALRRLAAWRSFTPACRVAQLYAGLPRGAALRGHNSSTDPSPSWPLYRYEGNETSKAPQTFVQGGRELEGMEAQIDGVDAEIARIEGLFASPDFHRTHATQTRQLTADLAAAKENLAKLYACWEELEATKAGSEK